MMKWVIWASWVVLGYVAVCFTPLSYLVGFKLPEVQASDRGFHFESPFGPNPAIWVVEDADSRIYLFGTIHILRPGTKWQSAKVLRAINDSDAIWIETRFDDDPPKVQKLVDTIGLDPKIRLSQRLAPEDRQRLEDVAAEMSIPIEALDRTEPWLASMVIEGSGLAFGGYRPEAGVEFYLERAAKLRNLPLKEMEETEAHMRFLADLPPKVQEEMLRQALYPTGGGVGAVDRAAAGWTKGDLRRIEADIVEMKAKAPELYAVLIDRRNAAWTGKIQEMLKGSGTHFIAVGTGHLVGPDSVQAKLAARGVTATRR